ncbi:MAG: TetR/AcrR family transcriptional regulator [Anaerolineae bacterium]|nr:MAG: TetR/AcrR family transcriptional regulator [Anaerolineae bacterium]
MSEVLSVQPAEGRAWARCWQPPPKCSGSLMSSASEIRTHILHKATELFVRRGYHGISMRELAEHVGVSKAGLYYHFKSKEELFLAILVENVNRIEALLQEARRVGPNPRQRIDFLFKKMLAFAPEQRAIIRLASQELGELAEPARRAFLELYHERFTGQVEAILAEGVEQGYLRPLDTHKATWILLGMMYPFFYPTQEAEIGALEDAVDLMLTIFFEGAQARPATQMEEG